MSIADARLLPFEAMSPLQRRLHNAAIVLEADGDAHGFPALLRECITALAQQAPAVAGHVGDSAFERWFVQYDPAGKGVKQRARDAYAAGMSDPAAQQAPAAEPYYVSGPYADGSYAMCETDTGRVVYRHPQAAPDAQPVRFDASTKVCTMNCGPSRDDPRTAAERKLLCCDCVERWR